MVRYNHHSGCGRLFITPDPTPSLASSSVPPLLGPLPLWSGVCTLPRAVPSPHLAGVLSPALGSAQSPALKLLDFSPGSSDQLSFHCDPISLKQSLRFSPTPNCFHCVLFLPFLGITRRLWSHSLPSASPVYSVTGSHSSPPRWQ